MNLFNKISKWVKMKFQQDDNSDSDSNLVEYKIIVLGDRSVGKSSICMRFAMNEFNLEIKPTSSTECYSKSVKLGEQKIKMYLIDIDEHVLRHDRSYLYADTKGVIVVYDVTKSKTFDRVDFWITDFRQNYSMRVPILIIGNKCDLNFLKNVDGEEAQEKADSLNCEFLETSCVESESVKDGFKLLIAQIYYNDLPESKKNYFKLYFSADSFHNKKDVENSKVINCNEEDDYLNKNQND